MVQAPGSSCNSLQVQQPLQNNSAHKSGQDSSAAVEFKWLVIEPVNCSSLPSLLACIVQAADTTSIVYKIVQHHIHPLRISPCKQLQSCTTPTPSNYCNGNCQRYLFQVTDLLAAKQTAQKVTKRACTRTLGWCLLLIFLFFLLLFHLLHGRLA